MHRQHIKRLRLRKCEGVEKVIQPARVNLVRIDLIIYAFLNILHPTVFYATFFNVPKLFLHNREGLIKQELQLL